MVENEELIRLTLPSGNKVITIVEGVTANISVYKGAWINSIILYDGGYTKIAETNVAEKFIFLGVLKIRQ